MDEDRPVAGIADIAQHRQQVVEIVSVDRPDIVEAELLEHRAAGPEAAGIFLGAPRLVVEEARQLLGELLGDLAQRCLLYTSRCV